MADDFEQIGSFFSRWSRRKLEQAEPERAAPPPAAPSETAAAQAPPPAPLPSVESLTPASDFVPFMQAQVDPGVKRAALKQLFKDPQFNVMDGLDTYIEDYSIPDPIPEAMMKTMYQAREHLFSAEEKALADAADNAAAKEPPERLESPTSEVAPPGPQVAKVPAADRKEA